MKKLDPPKIDIYNEIEIEDEPKGFILCDKHDTNLHYYMGDDGRIYVSPCEKCMRECLKVDNIAGPTVEGHLRDSDIQPAVAQVGDGDYILKDIPDKSASQEVGDNDDISFPGNHLIHQQDLRLVIMVGSPFSVFRFRDKLEEVKVGHEGHIAVVPCLHGDNNTLGGAVDIQRVSSPHFPDFLAVHV